MTTSDRIDAQIPPGPQLIALAISNFHYLMEIALHAIVLETEGTISFSNSLAQQMLGVTADALIGRRIDEYLEPAYMAAIQKELRKPGAGRRPFVGRRLCSSDGSAVDIEVAAVPLTIGEKRAVQVVLRPADANAAQSSGVAVAESQFRVIEDKLPLVLWTYGADGRVTSVRGDQQSSFGVRASQGRLGAAFDVTHWLREQDFRREAVRADAVGQLAGGVAHEINNVLAIISSNAQLLAEQPVEVSAAADVIVQATTRAAEITRNLLAFAMRDVYRPSSLTLNDVIRTVTEALTATAPTNVAIDLKLGPAMHQVVGDEVALSRALTNICVNAIDAMPDGGQLTIETAEVESGTTKSDAVYEFEVRVTDTGIGMDDSTREQAFDPFFSAFSERSHVGLGLSMVYGVVAQHGGTIRLDSAPGAGTTVTLHLPAANEVAPTTPVSLRIPSGRLRDVSTRPKVLVVDDEPMLRALSSRMLGTLGYQCVVANDGASAIERFRESPGDFACVLLDVVMPVMSGIEAIPHLLAIDPDVRVVLCTGYFRDELVSGTFARGALEYLGKPYMRKDLREAIERVTGHIRIAA